MKILFLCSTNICRSPYAEYNFRRMTETDPVLLEKVEWVRSAAVLNHAKYINKKTRAVLIEEGFDPVFVDAHKPLHISDAKDLLKEADLLIGMTGWQKAFVPKEYKHKYLTLSEAATGAYAAVPDPFLYKEERYKECLETMLVYFKLLADRIKADVKILK